MGEGIVLKWPMDGPEMGGMMLPGPVIAVAWQHGKPTLWIEHRMESRKVHRGFLAVPTGIETPPGGVFVGSAVSDELVFHVYEMRPADLPPSQPSEE